MADKAVCEICNRTFKNQEGLDLHNRDKHGVTPKVEDGSGKSSGISRKHWAIAGVAIAVIVVLFFIFGSGSPTGNATAVEGGGSFAQCLTDSGVKMYGAYWCPHCADQKKIFGSDWENVDYVECSLPNRGGQTAVCNRAGIQSYPTWDLGNGRRVSGVQSLESLSQMTGCSLN